MWSLIRCVVLTVVMLPLAKIASATDDLYRCADGMFTNRVERQCQPYESTGIVRGQGGAVEAAKSTVKGDEEKQPVAEVKLFQEPVKHPGVRQR